MSDILVKQLAREDLTAADRIFRLAFGTLLSLPEPLKFADAEQDRKQAAVHVCQNSVQCSLEQKQRSILSDC